MKFAKLLFVFIIILAGCSTFSDNNKPANPGMLEPQSNLRFSDIPVPMGLRALPQSSYSFEASGVRVGILKYQGKADAEQIINFYKEQMGMYNWNLVNIIEYGQRLMNFEREAETCIITMETRGNNVILTISLGPKSQNLAKKSKTPIK